MPGFREKQKKLKEKYWAEQTLDVEFEEIDARLDDIFKPSTTPYGNQGSESLP